MVQKCLEWSTVSCGCGSPLPATGTGTSGANVRCSSGNAFLRTDTADELFRGVPEESLRTTAQSAADRQMATTVLAGAEKDLPVHIERRREIVQSPRKSSRGGEPVEERLHSAHVEKSDENRQTSSDASKRLHPGGHR